MLIKSKINRYGDLILDAYSFNMNEIESVTHVLKSSNIRIERDEIAPDFKGRTGVRFQIFSDEIRKLQHKLNLEFSGQGEDTDVSILSSDQGANFKCLRIDTPPSGCVNIKANNKHEALVKCALIANSKRWLGAIPSPGSC